MPSSLIKVVDSHIHQFEPYSPLFYSCTIVWFSRILFPFDVPYPHRERNSLSWNSILSCSVGASTYTNIHTYIKILKRLIMLVYILLLLSIAVASSKIFHMLVDV